ncbi:hypothetical protein BC831DRAFT_441581 [Entophlyctis helioformis]|nr:hypothetical protein BC831DRAFT_441581 [Entophlyctis helioformis]
MLCELLAWCCCQMRNSWRSIASVAATECVVWSVKRSSPSHCRRSLSQTTKRTPVCCMTCSMRTGTVAGCCFQTASPGSRQWRTQTRSQDAIQTLTGTVVGCWGRYQS